MSEYGVDNWCYRMEEHRSRNHMIRKVEKSKTKTRDAQRAARNTVKIVEQKSNEEILERNEKELWAMSSRIQFWEQHHVVPTALELDIEMLQATV